MSSVPEKQSTPFSITAPGADPATSITKTIADQIAAKAQEYTNKILTYLILVVAGAIAASVWSLNGLIYKAVGETSVSTKALEMEITRLKDEVSKLQNRSSMRDCLENKKVTDKAGCYRGN